MAGAALPGECSSCLRAALLGAVALAGAASPAPGRRVTVRSTHATSRSRCRGARPGGLVRAVRRANRGNDATTSSSRKKRTRILRPGQRQTITASFPRKGTFRFLCSVSGHARLGMKGVFGVSVKPPRPATSASSDRHVRCRLAHSDRQVRQPVLVTAPPGDTSGLSSSSRPEPSASFATATSFRSLPRHSRQGHSRGESGLLSIAFAPDYAPAACSTRSTTPARGRTEICGSQSSAWILRPRHGSTLRRSAGAHDSEAVRESQRRDAPVRRRRRAVRVGGRRRPGVLNRAGAFAQRLDVLLGNIIRIDPRRGDPYAVPERQSLPRTSRTPDPRSGRTGFGTRGASGSTPETDVLYVPDVGSTSREEINVVERGGRGANFGWPCFEGTVVFDETDRARGQCRR